MQISHNDEWIPTPIVEKDVGMRRRRSGSSMDVDACVVSAVEQVYIFACDNHVPFLGML